MRLDLVPDMASRAPALTTRSAVMARVPILTYHNVADAPPGATHRGLYVTAGQFERQMRVLRALGYRGVSMDEGLPYLRGEKRGRVAVITFDDGYQDNLQTALPILRRYGFTATCYLVSDCIGTHNAWDAQLLKVQKPLMDLDGVRRWLEGGMQIGSHTRSHPHLPALDAAGKRREILESKRELENLLQRPVEHFCFPYGEYDEACVWLAEKGGYSTAVTTRRGAPKPGQSLFALPREGNSGRKSLLLFIGRALLW